MTTCAVLLDQAGELPPPDLLADVIETQAGFPRPAAVRLATRARWFIWENAPAESAQAVAQGLSAAGFATRAVPQGAVVPPTNPRRVHVLNLEGDALGVQLKYTGPLTWIPWDEVLVLSAGAIKTETRTTEVRETVVARGIVVVDSRVQVDLERAILAEIYATAPSLGELLCLRLNSREVNYAQTIGGSINESWREKFSLLLARLGLRATSAAVSPQTEALLAAGLMPDNAALNPYFSSEEEFALYNRWLATRKRLG